MFWPQNLLNFLYKPESFLDSRLFSCLSPSYTVETLLLFLFSHMDPSKNCCHSKNEKKITILVIPAIKVLCTTLSACQFGSLTSDTWTCSSLRSKNACRQYFTASASWYLLPYSFQRVLCVCSLLVDLKTFLLSYFLHSYPALIVLFFCIVCFYLLYSINYAIWLEVVLSLLIVFYIVYALKFEIVFYHLEDSTTCTN